MRRDLDFEQLVREFYAPLYRFAWSLSQNESDASDLVQQTFYQWARKGHQLSNPAKVKSWLFTTLHREFLGRRRHDTRFPHHELTDVEAELPEAPPEIPKHLDCEVVLRCLNRMDETFLAPISLFYLEDYSYNEIASILEIPLGTVKSRISRGLVQLQQMLADPKTSRKPAEQKPQ